MYMNTIEISVISITFLIIIIFLINRNAFIIYSNTILGKLTAIIIIILYSKIHINVGFLLLVLIVVNIILKYYYELSNVFKF